MHQQQTGKRRFNSVLAVELALAAVLLAVLVVFLLGFVHFSHPFLTAKASELAKKSGADTCTIGKVRAAAWKGVSLHDVVMAGSLPQGRRYSAHARSLSVGCNFAAIALKRAAIRRALAQEADGLGNALQNEPFVAAQRLFRSAVAVAAVKGMDMEKANVRLSDRNADVFSTEGMTLRISADRSGGSGLTGECSAAKVGFRGLDLLNEVDADFSDDGTVFTLSRGRARLFDGKVRCDARVDLSRGMLARGSVSAHGCDIDKWYMQADTANGRCRGRADFRIVLDSGALAADSLTGKGSVSIARFEVSGFPFQKILADLLLYPPVMRLNFRKFSCDFTLRKNGTFVTDAVGEGDSLHIKASGTISATGRINQKFVCTLSKDAVKGLPELAQKSLEDAPGGGRVLRFRLYGPLANPKFEIDSQVILQKAVKNMFEDVKQNIQLWLK